VCLFVSNLLVQLDCQILTSFNVWIAAPTCLPFVLVFMPFSDLFDGCHFGKLSFEEHLVCNKNMIVSKDEGCFPTVSY
jgi:hypothetical protein